MQGWRRRGLSMWNLRWPPFLRPGHEIEYIPTPCKPSRRPDQREHLSIHWNVPTGSAQNTRHLPFCTRSSSQWLCSHRQVNSSNNMLYKPHTFCWVCMSLLLHEGSKAAQNSYKQPLFMYSCCSCMSSLPPESFTAGHEVWEISSTWIPVPTCPSLPSGHYQCIFPIHWHIA